MFKIIVLTLLYLFVIVENSNNWRYCPPCRCYGDKKADCSRNRMNVTFEDVPDFLSYEIEVLNVTKHNIEVLRNDVFFNANLTNLWKLYLDKCSIKRVEKNAFRYLEQVTDISLMYNEISNIDSELFSTNTNLKYLWLDNNKIKKLPDGLFNGLWNLNGFYARFNQISSVENEVFFEHTDLWIIDLSNNKLEYLNATIIDNLKSLKVLFLHENMWSCDCHLQILHTIMLERNLYNLTKTVCTFPENLRGRELKLLEDSDFKCWQNVSFIPEQNRTVLECTNTTFTCIVDALPRPKLIWNFNNKNIAENTTKYTINISNYDTKYYNNLTILNLNPNDTGLYSCQVSNRELNPIHRNIHLTVLAIQKPKVKILGNHSESVQWDVKNYTLSCLVNGVPKPNIYWLFNNSEIDNLDKKFVITSEYIEDNYWLNLTLKNLSYNNFNGKYECIANNTKYISNESIFFKISEPILPEVNITTEETFTEGTNTSIICYVKAYSTPEFIWIFNGEIMYANDKKYKTFQKKLDKYFYLYNITISNITYHDIGEYTCSIKTKEGEEKSTIIIKKLYATPKIKIYSPIFENFAATIPCYIFSYPKENFCSWKYNETNISANEFYLINVNNISENSFWCNLTIFNVSSKNIGRYSCFANNSQGSADEYTDLVLPEGKFKLFSPTLYISFCCVTGSIIILILIIICKMISRRTPSKSTGQITQKDMNMKENIDFYDIPLENCPETNFVDSCARKEEDIMYIIERDLKSYDVTAHKKD